MKRIYLATSYTWKSKWVKLPVLGKLLHKVVMAVRYWRVTKAMAALLRMYPSTNIFSPITHSHHVPKWLPERLNTHTFWLNLDFDWISVCDAMWVYMQPGWAESYGVNEEIKFCQSKGIPIRFISMNYTMLNRFATTHLLDTLREQP